MAVDFFKYEIHNAVSGSIIMIDEMQLNVQIRAFSDHLKKQNNFVGYCLAVLTTSLALLTATFQDCFFPAQFWQSVFLLADGGLIVLAAISGKAYFLRKEISPDELIKGIKSASVTKECSTIDIIPYNEL